MSNNSIGPVDIEFALKNINFQAEAEKMKQGIKGVTTSAQQEAGKIGNSFKSGFGGVDKMLDGIGLSASALIGPAAGIAAAFKFKQLAQEALEFENAFGMAMREVQTISVAVQGDFEGISNAIVNMAANGPDDAIKLAKAYYQIVSAGIDGAAGLELLSIASKAATAGVTDTLTAADGLTTVINAWGLGAEKANVVADAMFKTVERGKTTFGQLASSIAQVAPLASANGIGLNEIFAAIQSITKQGTPTAQAMTQIRSSIINMNNTLGDGWSKTMTYQEGLNKIAEIAGGSSTALKKLIPDVEGMSAVLALTGEKAKGAAEDLEETTKAAGSMETAYGRMMLEADNKWSVVHNKWTREIRELAKSMKEGSSMFADFLNDLLTNEAVDIIDPGAKRIVDETASSIDGLATKEEKLTAVIAKINELRNKRISSLNPVSLAFEKEETPWLLRQFEKIAPTGGIASQLTHNTLVEINRDLEITKKAEKELFKLYTDISNVKSEKPEEQAAKLRTLQDITKEIEAAKKLQEGVSNKGEFNDIQKTIDKLEAEKVAITGVKTKVDELKAAQEALTKAIKSGDRTAIDSASARLLQLEKEKKGVQDIIDLEMRKAWSNSLKGETYQTTQAIESKQIAKIGQVRMFDGVMQELVEIDKKGKAIWKDRKLDTAALAKLVKEKGAEAAKDQKELDEDIADKKMRFQEDLLNYSRQFTGELINQLGITQDQADQLNSIADIAFNLASGNYLGAAFSAASTLLYALGSEKTDPTTRALENVNDLLERQSAILANIAGANYFELAAKQYADYGKAIDLNNKKLQDARIFTREEWKFLQADFKSWQEFSPNPSISFSTWVQNKYSETNAWSPQDFIDAYTSGSVLLDEQQLEWVSEMIDKQKQRAELLQETFRNTVGFDASTVSDSIFQGIEDGLKLSENGLGGWAQSFGDMVKIALMKGITTAMEMDITDTFLPAYQEAMKDGMLNDAELKELEGIYARIVAEGEVSSENIKKITDKYGASTSAATGMTGISASATEDTVSAMVGQLMAVRVDIKDILKQMAMGQDDVGKNLLYLKEIAQNTSYNKELVVIRDEMKEMNQTLKARL